MSRASELLATVTEASIKVGDKVKVMSGWLKKANTNQAKIIRKMLKEGGGSAEVISISGKNAEIAASKSDALLGTASVPLSSILAVHSSQALKKQVTIPEGKDNSYGLGQYEPKFTPQGYLTSSGKPVFTYFPDQKISMYTYKADTKFTITEGDLPTLMSHGLMKVAVNEKGNISLYFKKEAKKVG